MALTVGFDATAAVTQRAGIGRYARELIRALAQRDDPFRYRLFHAGGDSRLIPPLDGRFQVRALSVSDRVTNVVWHRARLPLPIQLFTGPFDLFHSPDFTAPPSLGKPAIITIHDLAFIRHPECAYPTLRAYLDEVVPRQIHRAAHVVTDSDNSKRDIIELIGIPEERVTVAYPGVSEHFTHAPSPEEANDLVRRAGIFEPFILSVSTLEPRKNYVRLLEAFALLRDRGIEHKLVIAGRPGWMYQPIFEKLRALQLEDRVAIFGPNDETLRALYAKADVYVCAALYEGFGITAAEALCAGLPVACALSASLPEVVGDAALMFDPYDVEAIADAIERLLTDEELAQSLRVRGPVQAARFSWATAATTVVSTYQAVIDG